MTAPSLFLILALAAGQPPAEIKLGERTTVVLATAEEAAKILTQRDDFVKRMSPFDRAARLKTDRDVPEEEYLKFVGKNVLDWDDDEKKKLAGVVADIQTALKNLSVPLPEKVFLIKTTGAEEGGAAYTRANAVILPKSVAAAPAARLQKTLCHELFHVLSRANPELRDKLYAAIGFEQCDELPFPKELAARKITNPDAPVNDHRIRLKIGDKEQWAIPVLYASAEKYDPKRGGEFFTYLQFRFLVVERAEGSAAVKPVYEGESPKLVEVKQVSGFFEQVGKNTQYIIHPEEILADNFALLVARERDLQSPAVVKKMEEILRKK